MKTTRVLLAMLLAAFALPPSAADHSVVCAGPDGYVVENLVAAWLRPGCLGASAGLGPTCDTNIILFHGQILSARAFASPCGAGAWLP